MRVPPCGNRAIVRVMCIRREKGTTMAEGTKRIAWRCIVCGHIEYLDELPEDYECPLCGVGPDEFEQIEVEE